MVEQNENTGNTEKTPPLSVEELLNLGHEHIVKKFVFDMADGSKLEREVVFRRLSYNEITELSRIPEAEPDRYTRAVIHLASISPKFEDTDQISKVPSGFVRHYSALILRESGKDPFLG